MVTAPTGGSAEVLQPLSTGSAKEAANFRRIKSERACCRGGDRVPLQAQATLSAAESGCQVEIGVASAMVAALVAGAYDASPKVLENAAESALEHHLGMTCDPVAGYVQVPCIERCHSAP